MPRPIPSQIPRPAAALLALAARPPRPFARRPDRGHPGGPDRDPRRGLRLPPETDGGARIGSSWTAAWPGTGRSAATSPISHHGAVCPLDGVGAIEIAMGPEGDMVEILDRLPIPLTARLGGGSDKMVANGEPDTCYPEGSRRNRCVGGPGRDICFTGQRNSDCVGGGGRDYCHHGRGSDGCWGGRGDDICVMGAGTRRLPRRPRRRPPLRRARVGSALRRTRPRLL